jgi:dienelactone hydrolase
MSDLPTFTAAEIDPLRRKLYEAWDGYFTAECHRVHAARGERWARDYSSPEAYLASVAPNRDRWLTLLGGWPWPRGPLHPRLDLLGEGDGLRLFRLFYTALPGIEIDALLLVPPGSGPFAAVLAQHGLNGTPEQALGLCDAEEGNRLYNGFGLTLARRGYLVLAPHMVGGFGTAAWTASHVPPSEVPFAPPHWTGAPARARTQLHRKALMCGQDLMGAEMFALSRAIDYLQSREDVDGDRIGMYGLSQGGMSALWLPALDPRVRATVAAAYFNNRFKKLLIPDPHYTPYLLTEEEDKILAGQLREFMDSDLASLICPRAFMAEVGRGDTAVWWEGAVEAFEECRVHYQRLGLEERVALCLHDGGHETRQVESLAFLDQHLRGEDR